MPYSDDRAKLDEMLPYIQKLATGNNVQWKITQGKANTVAFKIREALRLARIYAKDYPELARYASDYSIAVVNHQLVRAKRRTPLFTEEEVTEPIERFVAVPREQPRPMEQDSIDVKSLIPDARGASEGYVRTKRLEDELRGPKSVTDIVDVYERLGLAKTTINFPDAALPDEGLTELFLWADARRPRLMILQTIEGLTIALWDPMVAEYSWRPNPSAELRKPEGT